MEEKNKKKRKIDTVCLYSISSAYPDEPVAYNWLNYSFPYYHTHDFWEIVLITHGSTDNLINGEQYILKSGDAVLLRPHDAHNILNLKKSGCKHLSFLLTPEYVAQYCKSYSSNDKIYQDLFQLERSVFTSLSNETLQKIINTILHVSAMDAPVSTKCFRLKLIVNQLLNAFIEKQYTQDTHLPDWFSDLLLRLNNPFFEMDNVKQLASEVNYSYPRLSVLFKAYTGTTIIEYVTKTKMAYAKELLTNSNLSILDIAMQLNYDSLSHFIRTFKKVYGYPPKQYRKQFAPQ